MFNKNKKDRQLIKFWIEDDFDHTIVPMPNPAHQDIPKWYKDLERYDGGKLLVRPDGSSNVRLKACASYLDPFLMGYMVKLHCDIFVEKTENGTDMRWTSALAPLSGRTVDIASDLPEVAGYGMFTQAWEMRWAFTVPKGYSVLVTQPFNRQDLPTFSTTGIIDADDLLGPGGVPFAVKQDFEGIIKAGTPILQLIPFKRESWDSEETPSPFRSKDGRPRNIISGWYKDNIWKKKDFK